jgi:excisionase family DNA binding protein
MSKKLKAKPAPAAPNLSGRAGLSRAEAAASIGCDVQTIDSMISTKTLRASRVGRRVIIRPEAIKAMLDANAI